LPFTQFFNALGKGDSGGSLGISSGEGGREGDFSIP